MGWVVRRTPLVLLLLWVSGCSPADGDLPVIGLLTFAPDPVTERSVQGLRDGLAERGWTDGVTMRLVHHDAQRDFATIQVIAQKLLAERVDVIVPMSTPCLVATANVVAGSDQVVVFAEVFDPFRAGVAVSPSDHPANLVGVSSPPPVEQTLDLLVELVPAARRVGTIYNPGEANSRIAVESMRAGATARGLELVERTVSGSAEVQQAALSLLGQVDAFYITGDNTVGIGFEAVAGTAADGRLPLVCNTPAWVERGVAVAMGPDFYTAGVEAAAMIDEILGGADPATMDIRVMDVQEIQINLEAARAQDLVIPPSVIRRATGSEGAAASQ